MPAFAMRRSLTGLHEHITSRKCMCFLLYCNMWKIWLNILRLQWYGNQVKMFWKKKFFLFFPVTQVAYKIM